MSLVTVGKNGRRYQRKFDHDEARCRWKAGESVTGLAREFGVSVKAIYRVVDPEVGRLMRERVTRKYAAVCENCGGPCISIRHPAKRRSSPDGRDLCIRCRSDEKIERLRFDPVTNELVAVRCNMLDCANGDRWQPPDRFPRGSQFKDLREGGIHGVCRSCGTRMRANHRARNREADNAYSREYKRRRRQEAA